MSRQQLQLKISQNRYKEKFIALSVPATNDAWEHTEVLKLDPHTESWQPELQGDGIALNNRVETAALPFTSDFSRQYPGFPGGDGQVPNPIQPEDPNQPGPGKPGGSGSGGSGGSGGEQPGRPGIPAPGCLADRGQFPSPNNCANYLNCWDETVIEQQCPNNLLFNDVTGLCDFEQNVNCGNRPGPTPSKSSFKFFHSLNSP